MKILVTGGAGYIGSITAAHLILAGHEVTVLDNLSRGHRDAVPRGAVFISGDIGDASLLSDLLEKNKFDAVMHFAGFIEAGESMEKPEIYFENNVEKGKVFLQQFKKAGVNNIVFSSSAAVYAGSDNPLKETDALGPKNNYGQTKLDFENLLTDFNSCSLRYFNASGACNHGEAMRGEKHNPETHLIPRSLDVAIGASDKIFIYGTDYKTPDGTCVRDYVHVDDIASAHIKVVEALVAGKKIDKIYNIGTGLGHSVREVIASVGKVTGENIAIELAPRRPGDADFLVADYEKIKNDLGWEPQCQKIEDVISSAWKWHKHI